MNQEPKAMDELKAIRERVEKATKGPWELRHVYHRGATVWAPLNETSSFMVASCGHAGFDSKNADFIAHSRADIEFLLAKLDQAGKLAEAIEQYKYDALYPLHPRLREAFQNFRAPTPPEAK